MKKLFIPLIAIMCHFIPNALFAQTYSGSTVVNAGNNMVITVFVDPGNDSVNINLTGPDGVWYAFGFDNSIMTNTYCIVTDGSGVITERKLGNHAAGIMLTSSLTSSSHTSSGGIGTTVVTRSLIGMNSDYYTFPNGTATISLIWGYGNGSALAYHAGRGATTINLTQNCVNTASAISPSTCTNYTSPSGNYTWTSTGSYTDTIANANGCDSVITVNLTVNNSTSSSISPVVCNSYTSPSTNYVWTSTGIYSDTIANTLGCDSVITVNLTINTSTSSSINPSACNSYDSPSGNYTWTSSGNYTDTINNTSGCDSIITINLTINTTDTSVNQTGNVLTALASNASYQWLDCDNGYMVIAGADSQIYMPNATGNYAVQVNNNGCIDTSACYYVLITGILNNSSTSSISLYPNPSSGKINIILSEACKKLDVNIVTIDGKLVDSKTYHHTDRVFYNISSEPGMYFVEVKTDLGNHVVYKVIKY